MHSLIGKIGLKRQQEIISGAHAMTYPPLYVVYEEVVTVSELTTDFNQSTTLFEEGKVEYRRYNESAWIPAKCDDDFPDKVIEVDGISYGIIVSCSFHDRFVTVAFTREAAEQFINAEKHNLTNPRIWVHHIPYRNAQLTQIGCLLGDKQ